jgi:pyruvate-ferredoxin/flavodoxin oxidoreductase
MNTVSQSPPPAPAAARKQHTIEANEAVASVAHRLSEVIAIYPITPSSSMGELADEWSAKGKRNVWGAVPSVVEMQSEGGAAGAVHGALQAGALATTFTASQGLLLMVPNMYKIAGELTSFCMHVAARSLAAQSLSIFGDHADVMAVRQTGFALLCSGSGQEAQDLAAVAHAATLESRVPFLHFFDGFRTSAEVTKIEELTDADLRALIADDMVHAHRARALTPDRPVVRGTASNPDTHFQAREAANVYYLRTPGIVQDVMDRFAERTGRAYRLFDYHGAPDAERVIVIMGSGAEAVHETVDYLNKAGERVGVLRVRLYRPFAMRSFVEALPKSVRGIAVLDRTKEPGAPAEPLYLDVLAALHEVAHFAHMPTLIGGRYGLSSKEFTPAMVKAVFDELARPAPRRRFTVGINDDVTLLSLDVDESFDIEPPDVVRAVFYGLGSDGTVGSNKNTIKVIGEETPNYAQGYFVYDSKKSGSTTVSHLRFGPRPIRSTYKIRQASFVGCHQPIFLDKYDILEIAAPGGVFLLNTAVPAAEVWDTLPRPVQQAILDKGLTFYVVDGYGVAEKAGLGRHISTVMQTCFFAISQVLPHDEAIAKIKQAIDKSYGKRGLELIKRNYAAVDMALAHLHKVTVPGAVTATRELLPPVPAAAPDFVQRVTAVMLANQGDRLPVSAFPVDGTWPMGTTQWEKRNIALQIPIWESDLCIQCGKCAFVCPHAAVRAKLVPSETLAGAPASFRSMPNKMAPGFPGHAYTIQVAPEDCTGCSLCVQVCPAKDKSNPRRKALNMAPHAEHLARERENYAFFLGVPDPDRTQLGDDVKGSQLLRPLMEYSGACAGCGETPYLKLLTQLFGDRALIANATGCSSIYGGNLPTTPYTVNADGRGPAWANSLFEDNAEFGLGMRVALDTHVAQARELLLDLQPVLGEDVVTPLYYADQSEEGLVQAQRARVADLKLRLGWLAPDPRAARLAELADYLVKKSVWLVGGDGWAYDIGYGGLDHVLASNRKVNVLVLDTEVYSNTGGQASKATPLGAAAKFASSGKATPKKDLGMLAMSYGHVYVANVAFGANDAHTVRAFREAEAHPGPSLIIAYSHCIAHGYDLIQGLEQQKLAVKSGQWPLYHYDPRRADRGQAPLAMDSPEAKVKLADYVRNESRFKVVEMQDPKRFAAMLEIAERDAARRYALYKHLSDLHVEAKKPEPTKEEQP